MSNLGSPRLRGLLIPVLMLPGFTALAAEPDASTSQETQEVRVAVADGDEEGGTEQAEGESQPGLEPEDPSKRPAPGQKPLPPQPLEVIRVVASTPTNLTQDDAVSGVDFSQQQLLAEGISDIRDLSGYTPNLEIKTAFAATNPTLFIRGVGLDDFNSNSASAVSVYQDGFYMNSPAGQLFGLYDVESVEVLRGPQPTLTNASAGAIEVRSRKPADDFEAYLTSTFGNYNLREFQGALNVPVVPEWVAVRGAFSLRQRDGITENACPDAIARGLALDLPVAGQRAAMGQCRFANGITPTGFPPGPSDSDAEYVNNVDNWAARALVSMAMPLPDEQEAEWILAVSGGQNNSLATQYQHTGMREDQATGLFFSTNPSGAPATDRLIYTQDFTAGDNFAGEYDRVGPEDLDLFGTSLTGTWRPTDVLEIESWSGYFWHDRATYANDDGGPKNWLNNDYTDEAWQVTQESKLRWLVGAASQASVGGFFLTETLDAFNTFRDNSNTNSPAFEQTFRQETRQWALYGSTHVELLDLELPDWGEYLENLWIDAAFRYNWATKSMNNETIFLVAQGGQAESNIGADDGSWRAWTGDISLTYNVTDDKSIYAKYSRGWKPGHFNALTLRSTQAVSPVGPEMVDSLELGLKTLWFDGRLEANLTAFKYDYRDLQVFQTTVDKDGFILRRLINADEAAIWGVEWDLQAEPIDGLVLTFLGAYLSSSYTKFGTSFERARFQPGGGVEVINVNVDYSGNRLIASPVWSWTGSAEYTFYIPPGSYGTISPRFSFAFKSDSFYDPNEGCGAEGKIPECLIGQPAYWLLNGALTYASPSGRFEVTGFVRNFLNKEYKIQSFDLTSRRNLLLHVYGDPRTVGATITFHF